MTIRPAVEWSRGVTEADWIAERLTSFNEHVVGSVVPSGFDAYARLLHPVARRQVLGEPGVRWSDVAAWSGIPLVPTSQFHSIALPPEQPEGPAPWRSQGPPHGTLDSKDVQVLLEVLRGHTTTAEHCWFCIWSGYGWDSTSGAVAFLEDAETGFKHDPPTPLDPIPPEVRGGPTVQLPHREYFLYSGELDDALAFIESEDQTPNLFWPNDHAWCVASEIDLSSTYIGGGTALVTQLLAESRIETLPAQLTDPISSIEGWVTELAEQSADILIETGEVVIETSRGTVQAALDPSTFRKRVGSIWTMSIGANGVTSQGQSRLAGRGAEDVRGTVVARLTMEIVGLVGW